METITTKQRILTVAYVVALMAALGLAGTMDKQEEEERERVERTNHIVEASADAHETVMCDY